MFDLDSLQNHTRTGIEVVVDDAPMEKVPKSTFSAQAADCKIDVWSITRRANWPSLTAQIYQGT